MEKKNELFSYMAKHIYSFIYFHLKKDDNMYFIFL